MIFEGVKLYKAVYNLQLIHYGGCQRWLHGHWGAAGVGKAMNTLLPHSQPYKESPQYGHKHASMCPGSELQNLQVWAQNIF